MKKPGLRTTKTALSVVIGAAIIDIINLIFNLQLEYFYVGIAAVFSMQKSDELSKDRAKNRVYGTFIGSVVAIIISFFRFNVVPFNVDLLFLFIGVVITISIVNHFKLATGVMIACVMLIASFRDVESSYVAYSIFRGLETILGSYISIFVNRYIFPYDEREEEE